MACGIERVGEGASVFLHKTTSMAWTILSTPPHPLQGSWSPWGTYWELPLRKHPTAGIHAIKKRGNAEKRRKKLQPLPITSVVPKAIVQPSQSQSFCLKTLMEGSFWEQSMYLSSHFTSHWQVRLKCTPGLAVGQRLFPNVRLKVGSCSKKSFVRFLFSYFISILLTAPSLLFLSSHLPCEVGSAEKIWLGHNGPVRFVAQWGLPGLSNLHWLARMHIYITIPYIKCKRCKT